MKAQPALAAAALAVAAAFALQAYAADGQAAPAAQQQAEPKVQQKDEPKDPAATCPCLEDKTAAAHPRDMRANQSAAAKVNPMFDRSKHYHPRDGGKL